MATTTPAERKALLFLALVGTLGAGVKGWRMRSADAEPAGAQPALERQLAAAERAARERRAWKEASKAKARAAGSSRKKTAGTGAAGSDSAHRRPRPAGASGPAPATGPVDVERADSAALDRLPGVGPALAARIVRHRDSVGRLGGAAGLDAVPGVGPALLRRLAPLVTFGGRGGR